MRILARGVVKTYGSVVALRGVDARIEAGELVSIEGPNGSGKSTLLAVLGLLQRPTAGSVTFVDVGESREERTARIGWLSHESWAYGDLSCRRNVELVAKVHGLEPAAAWERSSARWDLARFAERPLRSCSRGQQQRTALALAVLHQPDVLLLDEPATGLDARGVECLRAAVHEELARGASVVMVTHDPELMRGAVTRRIRLEGGRLLGP